MPIPCENAAGSLNNPNGTSAQIGTNNSALKPYVAPDLEIGDWQISSLQPGICKTNDQIRQETYVAETLNIAGAPINVFKLLGVHEQGEGSLLTSGNIIGSTSYPGNPLSLINSGSGVWRSFESGTSVVGTSYVGFDFGIKKLSTGTPEYEPNKAKFTDVGCVVITQSDLPNQYAKQVKVEIADGTCEAQTPLFSGLGNGTLTVNSVGLNATQGFITVVAITSSTFNVFVTLPDGGVLGLNTAAINTPFYSTYINFTISNGIIPFNSGDTFTIPVSYIWKRVGMYNLIQSPLPQTLGFKSILKIKAVKVTPTLFLGSGNWEISAFDILDSMPTNINNIQDYFFNENRDRDYSLEPIVLKMQYSPTDSMSDLGKFGISIMDTYSFTTSFASMVQLLGRPIVVGDILEAMPELQYDHNLKPIRKFLEVTDVGWSADGYSTMWTPTVYRISAQQALPSQETRDIFGTIDTQKYVMADSLFGGNIGEQIDTTPLTITEEIIKAAEDKVPETGSDDGVSTRAIPMPLAMPPANEKGQPVAAKHTGTLNSYIEDGLPKDGAPYGEGYALPLVTSASDGDYFRLYYTEDKNIAPRLYRYSAVKNRWIYLETDRRADYSSHKPSVRNILESSTKQDLRKKQV